MAIGDGVSAIASLAVTFGGFSPTAMDGVVASKEHVEKMEAMMARRKAALDEIQRLERARASKPKRYRDECGNTWIYVVVDESLIRLVGFEGEATAITIPDSINELPVYAIGADALARNDAIEEIICPDSIVSIGACAFRFNASLRKVVFPKGVAEFAPSWLSHCPEMEEIVLPGMLESIDRHVFDNDKLKRLYIGPHVRAIEPGSFEKSRLVDLVIDEANSFFRTDGDAIYTFDGQVLVAIARPVERYAIADGCRKVAKKACMGVSSIREVGLPDSLEELGEFAFSHCGIRSFIAPQALREIGDKAFMRCADLVHVELNEGLERIGTAAFSDTGIAALTVPPTVSSFGTYVTRNTPIVYAGPQASFAIDERSPYLVYDGNGGLYRRENETLHFIQLINGECEQFALMEGAMAIDDHAFAFNEVIREVVLPEGVVAIGDSAFRVCRNLERVVLPSTLKAIGDEAFIDTSLASIHLPAGFEMLGENALVSAGAHRTGDPPSLRTIKVDEGNPKFYVEHGMLCERADSGDRIIVFNDAEPDVRIPDAVTHICMYAFSNAHNIQSIHIGPNLKTIGTNGLSTWCYIAHISVDLQKPVEGRTHFEFQFPETSRSVHEISLALGGSSWVNVPDIMKHYDNCLVNAHEYNSKSDDDISAYEQVKLMFKRFDDPILLANVNRSMFDRIIRLNIEAICVDVARHDDRALMDKLVERGYLHGGNIEQIITAVGRLQDAVASGYLLEMKRRRFGQAAFDFDL